MNTFSQATLEDDPLVGRAVPSAPNSSFSSFPSVQPQSFVFPGPDRPNGLAADPHRITAPSEMECRESLQQGFDTSQDRTSGGAFDFARERGERCETTGVPPAVNIRQSDGLDRNNPNSAMTRLPGDPLCPPRLCGENDEPPFFPCSAIAKALGCDKKTVQSRAARENWPSKRVANRVEFSPPDEIALLLNASSASHSAIRTPHSAISFSQLTNPETRRTVTLRERAVLCVNQYPGSKTEARAQTVATFILKHPGFQISVRSLERWERLYASQGIDGLVDQKQGRVGRVSVVDRLKASDPDALKHLVTRGKAIGLEKKSIAAAARELSTLPNLPAQLRVHLHDAHASKSYVTPSLRAALESSPLTGALAQGPKAARLSSAFTTRDYENLRAGDVYTADDMTSNVLCWTEWPNARGFILAQPQVLPVLDVRSLRWLVLRVIMRHGGQYSSDDIWGLFGDVFDTFGLPRLGFLLEGGHWQANRVQGSKTGLTHDERIGGLTSLGLQNFRAFDPRGKAMIEGAFNILQRHIDSFPGYAGRDQRTQLPEAVKKQLALIKGGEHPSKYFPHLKQFADHVATVMENLNHERQDGQILRGNSPIEQWAQDDLDCLARRAALPDHAKWLYRSAMNVTQVTCNGVRVTQGSGKKMQVHYFDNPALLTPLQGQKVVVFWNDHNPEADACVCLPLPGGRYKFAGLAKAVQKLPAFAASPAQLEAEAQRKAGHIHYARTELRSIQPELQRNPVLIRTDAPTNTVATEIAQADQRVRDEEKARAASARRIREVDLTDSAREAALESDDTGGTRSTASDCDLYSPLPAGRGDGQGEELDLSTLFANNNENL